MPNPGGGGIGAVSHLECVCNTPSARGQYRLSRSFTCHGGRCGSSPATEVGAAGGPPSRAGRQSAGLPQITQPLQSRTRLGCAHARHHRGTARGRKRSGCARSQQTPAGRVVGPERVRPEPERRPRAGGPAALLSVVAVALGTTPDRLPDWMSQSPGGLPGRCPRSGLMASLSRATTIGVVAMVEGLKPPPNGAVAPDSAPDAVRLRSLAT